MTDASNTPYYKWLYILIGMAVLVNLSGLFITIIGPDGTFYAGIAKTMVLRHNYIDLYTQGKDFLDKPHFPFWITALSFELFGFKTWAYKLPGVLFMLIGAFYTYRFALKLYNKEIALWSALILLTAQHIIISNYDVRAEPYLTGLIIASVYHLYNAYIRNNYRQLLFGALFAAMAIMTKGMFAIIPIGGAIAGHLIITRQWRQLFHLRWLLAIVLTAIFVLPELYCLYHQFDSHPEKLIFDQHNVSGIKFFFWDSQFGRFFNTGPIKGSGDPFFFVHTLAWAFLPWSLLLFAAVYQNIKKHGKAAVKYQWFCLCGALLTFLLFSASKFQLPYYLNIVFPFFAIELAAYLYHVQQAKSRQIIQAVQSFVIVVMFGLIITLQYFFKPSEFSWGVITIMALLLVMLMSVPKHLAMSEVKKVIIRTVIAAFVVNLYLNLIFYPSLLKYQAGSEAAFVINKLNKRNYPVAQTADSYNFPLNFYIKGQLQSINPGGEGPLPAKPFYLYSKPQIIAGLKAKGWNIKPVQTFDNYWVSMLKPQFLNSKTRVKAIDTVQVVLVDSNKAD